MSKTNLILTVLIIAVLAVFGFFGWKAFQQGGLVSQPQTIQKFTPPVIINRGKASQERDAALEAAVRKISGAAQSYAKSHKGAYPESDMRNPCTGVSFCLKSVNINTAKEIELNPIPQMQPGAIDYYYRADNKAQTYCVKTPVVLETASTMLFQCTQQECKRAAIAESCTK